MTAPRPTVALVLLALLAGLTYWNSLENGFALDDESIVEKNALITSLDNLPRLFATDYWAGARDPDNAFKLKTGRYRPFVLLTFALQYRWWGLNPVPYHAVNVALHAGVSCLVYLLALRIGLTPFGAAVAGALFAVHPIHSEPVNMLVGRAELLMGLGVLASLLWAIQGRQGLSLTAFVVALLSKEQAAALPLLIALHQFSLDRRASSPISVIGFRAMALRYGGYGLVLAAYLLIRTVVLGKIIMSPVRFIEDPVSYLPWASWLLTVIKTAGLYMWLCLWPASLSADYSYDSLPIATSLADPGVLFGLLSWGMLLGLAGWGFIKGDGRPAFLAGFTVLAFLPASNLFFPVGTPMAERLFYLPSAGLCLLVGLGYERLAQSRLRSRLRVREWTSLNLSLNFNLTLWIVFVIACLAMTIRTVDRNRDWIDSELITLSVLKVFPHNAKAHVWTGLAAIEHKEWDTALRHFYDALRIYPDFETVEPVVPANMGLALVETGHISEGLAKIQLAVSMEPTWSELWRLLGVAYAAAQRYPDAENAFLQAVALNPDNRHAHFALSYIYLEERQYESALREAETAISLRPDFMEAHYIRGRALESLGRDGSAIEEYARVMKFDQAPGDVAERYYRLQAAPRRK